MMLKNMENKSQTTLRIIGFSIIVIGGAVISFGNTNTVRVIGGLMVAIGSAITSLT